MQQREGQREEQREDVAMPAWQRLPMRHGSRAGGGRGRGLETRLDMTDLFSRGLRFELEPIHVRIPAEKLAGAILSKRFPELASLVKNSVYNKRVERRMNAKWRQTKGR